MDRFLAILSWLSNAVATWLGAGAIAVALILLMDARARRAEPDDDAVRQAAELYRQRYGGREGAIAAIGDHMLAATFSPDGRHGRFLKRVSAQLGSNTGRG